MSSDEILSSEPESDGSMGATPEISNKSNSHLQKLFDKHAIQEQEIERLERQNEEYREKLINTIRERDLNEELLKNVRSEQIGKIEELERKVVEYESQLRVTRDRATAQEKHFHSTTKDLTDKLNSQISNVNFIQVTLLSDPNCQLEFINFQLSKKAELADRDKNEAVVKYAMKEGEIMRLKDDLKKQDDKIKSLIKECNELKTSIGQQRLEELDRKNEELQIEQEKMKHEKFDIENRWKLAEKRVEVLQLALNDQRQQNEVLRRQMLQLKEEKSSIQDQHRQLVAKLQSEEERKNVDEEVANKAHSEREEVYKNIVNEVSRTKEQNMGLNRQIEEISKENATILCDLQRLQERLNLEERQHSTVRKRLDELEGIEKEVLKSKTDARKARLAKEEAETDRVTAENEAEECRKQAERMLEITEQLTRRNSQLASEGEKYREQNSELQCKLVETEGALKRAESRLNDMEQDKETSKLSLGSELETLKKDLSEKLTRTHELKRVLEDERNEYAVYKKKTNANIKELKHEVSSLRRQLAQRDAPADALELPVNAPPPPPSSSSRASSITSMDQIGRCPERSTSSQSPAEEIVLPIQSMIEKIVKLQKQLARRTEKIEFLEEHVRQCLEELQKKTKIIQHYALREEASLLLPADDSISKVPYAKKGSAYSLMGSMWTNGANKKTSLQLATEINSRLQAVLEDTLIKNISLKSNVDTLGEEISRLSRENRQLTLQRR